MRRTTLLALLFCPALGTASETVRLEFDPIIAAEEAADPSAPALAASARADSPLERARVAIAYSRILQPAGIDPLLELSRDPSPTVSEAAVFALGQFGWNAAFAGGRESQIQARLVELAQTSTESVRLRAVEALGKIGLEQTPVLVQPYLRDAAAPVRAEAALALFRYRLVVRLRTGSEELPPLTQEAFEALVALAADEDDTVRRNVAYYFARVQDSRGLSAIQTLAKDRERWTRLYAVLAIGRSKEPLLAPTAVAALQDLEYSVRLAAVQSLIALGQAQMVPAELAKDSSHHVRAALAEAYGHTEQDAAAEALLRELLADESLEVRASALAALAVRKVADAAELIAKAYADESWVLREAALRAAAKRGEPGHELVLRAVRDPDERVRAAALELLAPVDSAAAFEAIRAALRAPGLAERGTAVEALRERKEPQLGTLLQETYLASSGREWIEIRETLVDLISAREDAAGVEWLRAAASDPAPSVAAKARAALAARGIAVQPPVPAPQPPASAPPPATQPPASAPPPAPQPPVPSPPVSAAPPRTPSPHRELRFVQNPVVSFQTSRGTVRVECFADAAPVHCANLVGLVRKGFYDGLLWHRVVPNFVVQGGDPLGTGWGDAGFQLRAEINPKRFDRAVLGMPRAQGFDTGSCQLFFTLVPTPHLDGQYTVFGQVLAGDEVLDAIERGDRIVRATADESPPVGTTGQ